MAIRESVGSSGRVEELAKVMTSAKIKLEKRVGLNRRLIEKHQLEVKALDSQLRILQTDMEMAFGTREFKVALLHKRVGGASYIKGRCWWRGKQREVQIGSIQTVIERINHMISQGECGEFERVENDGLRWETFKSDKTLVKIVKDMGRAKLREYIIKKLLAEHLELDSDSDDEVLGTAPQEQGTDHQLSGHPDAMETNADEWYVQWRRENL